MTKVHFLIGFLAAAIYYLFTITATPRIEDHQLGS